MLFGDSCLSNCNSRVITDNDLVLTAVCADHCFFLNTQLHVQWKLFVGGTAVDDDFAAVSHIKDMITGKQ